MSLRCGNIEGGLRIGTDGQFYACCLAWKHPYKDKDGNILNAKNTTFEEALNSDSAKELKDTLARGEKHPACKACWDAEDAGFESKRIRDTLRYDYKKHLSKLVFLEVNLGNTCNLACRICGIHASSSWRTDYANMFPELKGWEVNERVKEYNSAFVDDSMIWDELETNISQVKVLDLYGGEPMLLKKQWALLSHCVEKGYSDDMFVHFNTNGTIFNTKYVEILKHFKEVRISFSADGVEEGFDYTRYPGKWVDVHSNIKSWLTSTKGLDNFAYELTFTTSTLNVLHADKVALWILDHNLSTFESKEHVIDLYVSFVFAPEHYYIQNMPREAKNEIIDLVKIKAEKLKEHRGYKYFSYLHNELLKIAQTLETSSDGDTEQFKKFFFETNRLDKWRKQKFSTVFQDLFHILSKYQPVDSFKKLI